MKASTIKKAMYYILGIVLIFVLWIILCSIYKIVPYPNEVFIDLGNLFKDSNNILLILYTILKLLLIILISFIISFVIGFASYKSKRIRALLAPLMSTQRCLPVACISVVLIIILGSIAPIIITMFVLIPMASENIYKSLCMIKKDILEDVKLLTKTNFYVIRKIYLPLIAPHLISALLNCFGLGLKVLVMSELICYGANTIGYEIAMAKINIDLTRILSWSIILVIIDLIIELIIKTFDNKVLNKV